MATILKNIFKEYIGVIGAGSFGTAIANILAENNASVILYVRNPEKMKQVTKDRISSKQNLHKNIEVTNNLQEIPQKCEIIFPMIPSSNFRKMIVQLAPYLNPYHVLIHGTKGFDMFVPTTQKINQKNPLTREHVKTISEVIKEETSVLRIGCLAGPNLARELDQLKPAATVVASHFDEVVKIGQKLLKNDRFMVYGSQDLIGIELCGILKNIIAIGAGTISGMNLGENAKSFFISRGLIEMINIGKILGGNTQAFFGLAGIGDLIVTCTSNLSRNFTVGYRLVQGETLKEILESMDEVAEGVETIKVVNQLAKSYRIRCPITETLYKLFHNEITIKEAHSYLMNFPFRSEIDFFETP